MERANIKTTLADVFDYCTEHIGPLFIGKDGKLKLVQTTAYMFGGYAAKDMSAISETSFSEDVLQDPWLGASVSEVMAHEIIHQWWGLGAMFDDDYEGEWSSEGLTVYTTYRLMKEKYGDVCKKELYKFGRKQLRIEIAISTTVIRVLMCCRNMLLVFTE